MGSTPLGSLGSREGCLLSSSVGSASAFRRPKEHEIKTERDENETTQPYDVLADSTDFVIFYAISVTTLRPILPQG